MLNEQERARFCQVRRDVIALEFDNLNSQQREGVLTTEGPLLLLAGAGSGKTTVLIHRIANLVKYGRGSDTDEVSADVTPEDLAFLEHYLQSPNEEDRPLAEGLCRFEPAAPWNVCAITFTNKAAGEIKSRLVSKLGDAGQEVWAGTFHSVCLRILRRDIERLGFGHKFTIYDTDDSLRVIRDIMKSRHIDDRTNAPREILSKISKAKDQMMLAKDYAASIKDSWDIYGTMVAHIYTEYEHRLWESSALDFDDIILHTVRLLQKFEDVRSYWQRKFRYVLVDEYQDTNHMQYLLTSLLAGGWGNICVVGDDDQSIYSFRGATIENILSFEDEYRGARLIRLEQNYRSTENILEAANAVIQNNVGRKGKHLWTEKDGGELVRFYTAANEMDEGQYVASQIIAGVSKGENWRDFAVLYRMNAQSNQIENAFKNNAIPYVVFGGMKFYERTEVKDMLAYLSVVANPADDLRLIRIINNPARGIGAKTVETAQTIAQANGLSLFEVISHAGEYQDLVKSAGKLTSFARLISGMQAIQQQQTLDEFYDHVIQITGYVTALQKKNTPESQSRIENVEELKSSIIGYMLNAGEEATLEGFLENISLFSDLDTRDPDGPYVTLMTVHSAKGLEFKNVFLVGMEEKIFPGYRSMDDDAALEEERRLCYVAITRAQQRLYITCANQRLLFGRTSINDVSRFVDEIPEEYLERVGTRRGFGFGPSEIEDDNQDLPYQRPAQSGYRSRGTSPFAGSYDSAANKRARGAAAFERNIRAPHTSDPGVMHYQKGEMVVHDVFGEGMIVSITPMGGDALMEIAFDRYGTKKLMYKAASVHLHSLE